MVKKGLTGTSFDLNEDMLNTLSQEFEISKLIGKFCEAAKGKEQTEAIAKEIFGEYGRDLMRRTIKLGEEYPDRTYEVIKEAAQKTGELTFPHIPQRFLEIAYLGTQPILKLPIVENSPSRLTFRLDSCATFDALKERCGEGIAEQMPCRHACLAACESLFQDLNLEVKVDMEASMVRDGYCQFMARRV